MNGKRSRQIQLVTLGTMVLGGCADANLPKDRYAYKSQPECVADWGEKNCVSPSVHGGGGGYYLGPYFNSIVQTPSGKQIWSGNAGMPAVNPNTGQQMRGAANISRGGFGSSGSSFHSSGT